MLQIYKASAGSGKTYTLTRQYLQLLLGHRNRDNGKWKLNAPGDLSHRHILAITFTNKATEEMMHRIITELATIAGREPGAKKSDHADYLVKLFNTTPEELKHAASVHLDTLLEDYSNFHVCTIDAFFQTVLRAFAREIDRPDNFDISLDDKHTIALGVNRIFSSINFKDSIDKDEAKERKWLRDWVQNYMKTRIDSGNAANVLSRRSGIYSRLVSMFSKMFDETFKLNREAIEKYLDDTRRLTAFETGLRKRMADMNRRLADYASDMIGHEQQQFLNNNLRNAALKWIAGEEVTGKTPDNALNDITKRYVAAGYRGGVTADYDAIVERALIAHRDRKQYKQLFDAVMPAVEYYGLLGMLLRYISEYCRDNNVIMLSDTNGLLRGIINDDDTPFVYERIGYYLRHFLIDEFQDTSRMQWDNLKPLVLESLSYKNDNLVIGDEKQSIYRFRNADPDLLGHEIADETIQTFDEDYVTIEGTEVTKNSNWRSTPEVVRFNNTFFRYLAKKMAGPTFDPTSYEHVIQQISPDRDTSQHGYVRVMIQTEKPEKDSDAAAADFNIEQTIAEIDRMLSAGYRPSDIAVLVRKRRHGAGIINALLEVDSRPGWTHGPLQLSSDDTMTIASSTAVAMIIDVLRLAVDPSVILHNDRSADHPYRVEKNQNIRYARLKYLYRLYLNTPESDADGNMRRPEHVEALSKAIEALRDDKNDENFSSLFDEAEMQQMLTTVRIDDHDASGRDTRIDVACATLNSLIERIIERYIPPTVLDSDSLYLNAFQDLVYDFCNSGNSDIRSFLRWWDISGSHACVTRPGESESLKVMTIHQSKGLEFPCVIIPYANWDFIEYSTDERLTLKWMKLNKSYFPMVADDVVPEMLPFNFKSTIDDVEMLKDQVDRIKGEFNIDAVNITYVGFTRAVNELSIIVPYKSGADNLADSIAMVMNDVTAETIDTDDELSPVARQWLTPLAEMASTTAEPCCVLYELGVPTTGACVKRKTPEKIEEISTYIPATQVRKATMSTDDYHIFNYDNPRHRGNLLHKIMSYVHRPADLDRAIERTVGRYRLTKEQQAECRDILSRALADERVRPWFEGFERVLNEQTLAARGDIDRRPDRIVWTADGHIDIVDYKFGDMRPAYRDQLIKYGHHLAAAGYTSIRAFLWFPEKGDLLQIPLR